MGGLHYLYEDYQVVVVSLKVRLLEVEFFTSNLALLLFVTLALSVL